MTQSVAAQPALPEQPQSASSPFHSKIRPPSDHHQKIHAPRMDQSWIRNWTIQPAKLSCQDAACHLRGFLSAIRTIVKRTLGVRPIFLMRSPDVVRSPAFFSWSYCAKYSVACLGCTRHDQEPSRNFMASLPILFSLEPKWDLVESGTALRLNTEHSGGT